MSSIQAEFFRVSKQARTYLGGACLLSFNRIKFTQMRHSIKKGFTPLENQRSKIITDKSISQSNFSSRGSVNDINFLTGFTLIELILVIAIIGILSMVIFSSFDSVRARSRDGKRIADIKQIQLALEHYNDRNGAYPTALSALQTDGELASVPLPPSGAGETAYRYAGLGNGSFCGSYHLGATLEGTTHSALLDDSDAVAGTVCTGGGSDFSGLDGGICNGSTASVGACFDVKP